MKLVNVLALTHGKLVNNPFVSEFTDIGFEAKTIKRGDLFIAFNEESIEDAVLNGAYGVIFDRPTQISDNEIAWIKVDSIEESLKRLLRFRLIEKEIVSYKTNKIILNLALQITTESIFIAVSGDIKSISIRLWNIDIKSKVLFSPALCDENIFTDIRELNSSSRSSIDIVEHTLFETSFVFDNKFYERQQISPLFIPYLEELLNLYKNLNINYRIKKLLLQNSFEAIFINNSFEIKEFGTSDKVLIFEKDINQFKLELEFLEKNANWASIVYMLPIYNINKYETQERVFYYKNSDDLLSILKNLSFHFALIIDSDKSIVTQKVIQHRQLTLDF